MARLVTALILVTIMGVAAALVIQKARSSRADLPVLAELGPFELTERGGRPFTRDDFHGKLTVVDFIFTRCRAICPTLGSNMGELYRAFAGSDRIQFVSISVDPDHDTEAVLQAYARGLGVTDNRWLFLRGPIDSIVRICEQEFMLAADDLPAAHTTRFILVDQEARIRGYFDGMDQASVAVLKNHLRELVTRLP